MRRERLGFVYFVRPIGHSGPIKIGFSQDPTGRMSTLMTWAPVPLEVVATLPGGLGLERRIHAHFAAQHSHREWFHGSLALTAFINAVAAATPITKLLDFSLPVPRLTPPRKRNWPPEYRKYIGYSARVRCAFTNLYDRDSAKFFRAPADVIEILHRWSKCRTEPQGLPTAADILRLDEVLANPVAHGVDRELDRMAA